MGRHLIDALFSEHGVAGPWVPLPATGLANHVYATHDVVLRIATDHPDGVRDARTESVAAPVAHEAGVLTPRLIAFDDRRTLVDRPFSLWERIHGDTVGLASLSRSQSGELWHAVGRELARLHVRVRECPDPDGYLDQPTRESNIDAELARLIEAQRIDSQTARSVERLIGELRPQLTEGVTARLIHGDIHSMNIMCSSEGSLLAILDWGDAGWGDPAMDFAAIPLESVECALEGYRDEAPGVLGAFPEARFIWDRLVDVLDDLWDIPDRASEVRAMRELLQPHSV